VNTIVVDFEGKAILGQEQSDGGDYHCFWNARSESMIHLKCRLAGEDASERIFELTVGPENEAKLTDNGNLLARYRLMLAQS